MSQSIQRISDALEIYGQKQASVPISTAAAETPGLSVGSYLVWCNEGTVYINVGGGTSGLNMDSGCPILSGNIETVEIPADGLTIAGAMVSGTGTLRYHKVSQ